MFGTIRKHQQWLWAIIITLTIVSFLIFFSPAGKANNARRAPDNYGSINGQRVSRQDFLEAWRDLDLNYFFRSGGSWPNENAKKVDFDQQTESYQWLLLLQKAEQMGIHVSSDMVVQLAKAMLSQFQRAEINPDIFVQKVLQPHGLRLEDFERFVRHLATIQELSATVSLSGKLVTPQEARELYAREHEEL